MVTKDGQVPEVDSNNNRTTNKQIVMVVREAFKNYLADFVKGVPPPTPLTDNHFAKKTSAERRGKLPPPLTESPPSFSGKIFPKRAKNDVFFIK